MFSKMMFGMILLSSPLAFAEDMGGDPVGEIDNPSSCACNNNAGVAPYHVKNDLNYGSGGSATSETGTADSLGGGATKEN